MVEPNSDVQKNEFSVSGFSLREYRKIDPERYRYNEYKFYLS